jgi:uncharacterized membrane protein YdcZ (DUF606 family)
MRIFRSFVAVGIAYLFAYIFLTFAPAGSSNLAALPVAIIFAVVFGILLSIATKRREKLKESVATELNKLRRIYHLGKNLGASIHLRSWFTDLHGFVYDYLGSFEKLDLAEYDKSNPLFRRISYHVYTVPDLREVKEQALYGELLSATAAVSDARQKIGSLVHSSFTRSHWFALGTLAVVFTVATIAATPELGFSRFMTANVLASGYLLLAIFLEHDYWTEMSDKRLSKEYVKNISRLELRR